MNEGPMAADCRFKQNIIELQRGRIEVLEAEKVTLAETVSSQQEQLGQLVAQRGYLLKDQAERHRQLTATNAALDAANASATASTQRWIALRVQLDEARQTVQALRTEQISRAGYIANLRQDLKSAKEQFERLQAAVSPGRGGPRVNAYLAIDSERDYRDELGQIKGWSEHSVGAYLTLLQGYIDKGIQAWLRDTGDAGALAKIRSIAAIAVSAMEKHGAPMREPLKFKATKRYAGDQ